MANHSSEDRPRPYLGGISCIPRRLLGKAFRFLGVPSCVPAEPCSAAAAAAPATVAGALPHPSPQQGNRPRLRRRRRRRRDRRRHRGPAAPVAVDGERMFGSANGGIWWQITG